MGYALVAVKYFGLNRMDLGQRNGVYPVPPNGGKILGVEFSGVVQSVCPSEEPLDKDDFKTGDEVLGLTYGGR